jgi:hypothetical protein
VGHPMPPRFVTSGDRAGAFLWSPPGQCSQALTLIDARTAALRRPAPHRAQFPKERLEVIQSGYSRAAETHP